jgi:hypothetical protein
MILKNEDTFIPFQTSSVEDVFDSYPLPIREKLLFLRALIFKVASETSGVGQLEESLRWGEPSYITSQSKSGSIIRIHHYEKKSFDFAMYFHCGTNLVERFIEKFPNTFTYGGHRSIEFMLSDSIPINELKQCIKMALTYNISKNL